MSRSVNILMALASTPLWQPGYLQEKLLYVGQSEVYAQAAELIENLLGLPISASQIDRLTTYYGGGHRTRFRPARYSSEPGMCQSASAIVHAQADGAMLLTDGGYKKAKLDRISAASAPKKSVVDEREGDTLTRLCWWLI